MTTTSPTTDAAMTRFADERHLLLTTFRRDGSAVATPVHVATEGDVAYIRTFAPSGKVTRIRRNSDVEVAPSTMRGRPTGAATRAHARILDGVEAEHAGRLLAAKYPLLHGRLIPWFHRRRKLVTVHLELT